MGTGVAAETAAGETMEAIPAEDLQATLAVVVALVVADLVGADLVVAVVGSAVDHRVASVGAGSEEVAP